jgi:hypothetical protein
MTFRKKKLKSHHVALAMSCSENQTSVQVASPASGMAETQVLN